MKTCNKCKLDKDLSEFHIRDKNKQSYQPCCKSCRKDIDKELYLNKRNIKLQQVKERAKAISLWLKDIKKNLSCIQCGESHIACLQFHHRYAKDKDFKISDAIRFSKTKVLQEIDKCDCLCANCHSKLHWEEREAK